MESSESESRFLVDFLLPRFEGLLISVVKSGEWGGHVKVAAFSVIAVAQRPHMTGSIEMCLSRPPFPDG